MAPPLTVPDDVVTEPPATVEALTVPPANVPVDVVIEPPLTFTVVLPPVAAAETEPLPTAAP